MTVRNTMDDLCNYPIGKVASVMNKEMLEEIDRAERWYWKGTEPNISGYTTWGQMYMSNSYASILTLSNNEAVKQIMSSYVDSGDVEFESDYMRIRIYRVGSYTAKVYGDMMEDEDWILNGVFTEAFQYFYDNVLDPLSNYPVLDDDDFYNREWEEKQRAFDDEWSYVLNFKIEGDVDDLWRAEVENSKQQILNWLDGGDENPLTGSYEYIEISDDSAYVDGDDILRLLEHLGFVTSETGPGRFAWEKNHVTYTARIKSQEERAQIESLKYQLPLALEFQHDF